MRVIATLHNRRGDPLLLLRLLRFLGRNEKVQNIGVAWSVPSGNPEPSWEELVEEEKRVQEKLRDCVRRVHESGLSWEAKSFLGRCYRSFQYEFMVSLNLKRHDRDLKLFFLDDPHIRSIRYREIGDADSLPGEIETYPADRQADVLRARYAAYRVAYEREDVYEEMILRPNSVLLEASMEMAEHTRSRQEHMVRAMEQFRPDVVLLRLYQSLTNPSEALRKTGLCTSWDDFLGRVAPSISVMKLSQAESIVGPLPERD